MGKSTISMVIFNSKLLNYQNVNCPISTIYVFFLIFSKNLCLIFLIQQLSSPALQVGSHTRNVGKKKSGHFYHP